MRLKPGFPSAEHKCASETIVEHFSRMKEVESVILMGSCARGKATRDSCLDTLILVQPKILTRRKNALQERWQAFYESEPVFKKMAKVGQYSHVDLEFVDGCFVPKPRSWTSGPDEFELDIGNTLVYSVPLFERGSYFKGLKAKWLPYYNEELRQERLASVKQYCFNNLDHILVLVKRSLYFQAFNRLYDAFREFLQALFISRRIYPIAYDKWIREQVEEILEEPELYQQLPHLLEITHLESEEIAQKARHLRRLFEEYVEHARA
jgi:predicted nucleotidyltransferase